MKFDPIQIIRGDYRLFYEKMLAPHWSMEFGLGPTRRNYTSSWFYYELDNLGDNIEIKTRYAISASARYYFQGEEELYGPYLSAGVSHIFYKKSINVIDSAGVDTGFGFEDERRYTSFILTGGYQALGLGSNIFADFYLGLALRYRDFMVVQSTAINDPMSFWIAPENGFVLGVEFGVKIGFGF